MGRDLKFIFMGGKYVLTTLGCKVNQYESQQLREVLESFGFRQAHGGEVADLAVVNTCAVTADAARANRKAIRKAARGGQTPIVVVGCGAAADAQQLGRLAGVAAVWGHDADVVAELRRLLSQRSSALDTGRDNGWIKPVDATGSRQGLSVTSESIVSLPLKVVKSEEALDGRIESFEGHQRAFLKVQDGCDAHCTYCIIPRLRPGVKSKSIEAAVAEARGLVAAGHREIVLTGIFLGAYGRPTAIRKRFAAHRSPLAALVEALAQVDGLDRLRLSSLEPGDVDDDLLEVLAAHRNCVPHLHLPLQSGSGAILRRMNRQYTREAYLDMVQRVRRALDRPSITTDIIAGFPGETEADFEASLEVAQLAGFCKIHAFPFSPREGTAAARWHADYVAAEVVRERMRRIADAERRCSLAYRQTLVGILERVIVELQNRPAEVAGGQPRVDHGRADRYLDVHFESKHGLHRGELVHVRIDQVTPTRTRGEVVRPGSGLSLRIRDEERWPRG
jgi:threonylcarbamoyladenosine tRNA methylthiotransferase MtaB